MKDQDIDPAAFSAFFLGKYLLKPQKSTLVILLSAIFQMISTLALYGAYKNGGELSVVGPLAQTSTVLTILIGILVLRETWNLKRKIIGISLTLLGVALIKFVSF